MDFYTHFSGTWDDVLVSGYRDGKKFNEVIPYSPSLFIPGKGDYRTVDGRSVRRIDFDRIRDARDFVKQYEETSNFEIFGFPLYQYSYIYDTYKNIEFDKDLIKILNLDIETDSQDGFGDIQAADREIISISMKMFRDNNIIVLGLQPKYQTEEPELLKLIESGTKITYISCNSERELLLKFIDIWIKLAPDVLCNWNGDMFDIPTIIKRIIKVLSESHAKKLSPFGRIDHSVIEIYGKQIDKYDIVGIRNLDYLQVFKKFSFSNKESFSLEYISHEVLGVGKLDYSEYGSLAKLYKENFNKFIDYNILDVLRVEQIDNVVKYYDMVFSISYESLVNYTDTFTTIRTWDILIHNYLMDRKIVVPFKVTNRKEKQIAGGYVKDPQIGKHEWVMSFDFKSLYPHLTMTFNISPETYRGKFDPIVGEFSVDKILDGQLSQYNEQLVEQNLTATGKGTLFTRDQQGFVPAIMQELFNRRIEYSRLEDENAALLAKIDTEMARRGIEVEND